MPFIGNQPALSYTSFAKQDFTTSATTSYTLDNPVTNANELALFINFVRQEPTAAYSASGTTLTLTSATSATDDMYCVFLGKAVQTVNPPNASVGLSQLSATGTKDATTFLRGDNTFASAGGDNTPYFYVYLNSAQTVSNNTETKIAFDTEVYDTGNDFDLTNDYFVVPEDGLYHFIGGVGFYDSGANNSINGCSSIMKLGSTVIAQRENNFYQNAKPSFFSSELSVIRECSANDQITLYGRCDSTASNPRIGSGSTQNTFLGGYKLIT